MQRMKRWLAGFLCLVMLVGSLPMDALAAEMPEQTQTTGTQPVETTLETEAATTAPEETDTEPVQSTGSAEDTESTGETTEPAEETTEPAGETTEPAEETTESTEETTEPTEETTEPTEETTEPTEETTEPTEEEEPHWEYTLDENGFAVILGYTDPEVEALSIPYTIDDYYVTAIGERAFVINTALAQLYIHGNVQTIADDALEGLGTVLSGYNGTRVQSYAAEYGFDFRLRSGQDYLTFTERVIDYSYVQGDRYQYLDGSTIFMSLPEARPLEVGSLFFLPEIYGNLMKVYQVTGIANQGDSVILTVVEAAYEDALAGISMHDIELLPDWSQAQWEEGVEIVEEKVHVGGEGSYEKNAISISVEKSLGEKKTGFTVGGKKQFVSAKWVAFAEGSIKIKGKASIDLDLKLTGPKINDLSFTIEPNVTIKGGIKVSGGSQPWEKDSKGNISETEGRKLEIKPEAKTYRLASLPLVSASGVISVNVTLYLKVSASGEVTITVGGSGKLGAKYDATANALKGVNTWTWNPPAIHGQVSIEIGPCIALELECAVIGRVASLEAFAGVNVDASVELRFFDGGTADIPSGQDQTKTAGFCGDIDIDGVIKVGIDSDVEIIKKAIGNSKKRKASLELNTGYAVELINISFDIKRWHWDYLPESGWQSGNKCIFEQTATVSFCSYTKDNPKAAKVKYNSTIPEPELKEVKDNKILGWYTDKNFTQKWDFENDKVTKDMTFYAKWEKTAKTVAFVTKNEEVDVADWTEQYTPGAYVTKPAMKVLHWRLKGWFLDEALTDEWSFDKDIMPNKDLTLYASWEYDESYDPFASADGSGKKYEISGGKLYYNGHVYEHVANYQLFSAAYADAVSRGGYLVTISSQEEMDAVLDYVKGDCAQETLWLGINSTTDWKYWLNGEARAYWNGDQDPVTASAQYNAIFYRATGKWNTYDNGKTSHYIIEWGDYDVGAGFDSYSSSSGDAQYTPSADGESISVVGFGTGENVSIQNIYDGQLVTRIDDKAFQNNTGMKSISIPATVESIGEYAFAGCTALEEIELPASVKSIGTNAFRGCTSLKRVVLPNGITVLPERIFYGCTALEEVLNTDALIEIGQYAFYGCTALKSFPVAKVTTVGNYAFSGCTSLEILTFMSLTSIGNCAFDGCTGMQGTLVLPAVCTNVRGYAFRNCTGLQKVFLLCSGTAVSSDAFEGISAPFYGKKSDGIDAWCKNNGKRFVDMEGIVLVRFYSDRMIKNSTDAGTKANGLLEDQLLTAGTYLTEPVLTLEGYYLEGWYTDSDYTNRWDFARDKVGYEDLTLYAKWVEENSIFNYYVENGGAVIKEYTGTEEKVKLPDTLGGYPVTGIGEGAFSNVTSMESLAIPATVTTVAAGAFRDCLNLYTITFPNGNDSLTFSDGVLRSADGKNLIYVAEGHTLTKFVVPEGTERIFSGALRNQSGLSQIEIPDTVKEIGEEAFPTSIFLKLYGPDEDCAAKRYAEGNGLPYNEYTVTFYDGKQQLFSAVLTTGSLLTEYAEFESDYATYAGWYRDSSFTEAWDFETDTMPAGNLSLYLKWNSDFAVAQVDSGLTITGYVGSRTDVTIPEKIGETAVVGIAANAFLSTADAPIRSVSIPDCVTTIADGAFSGKPAPVIVANAGSQAESYARNAGLTFEKRPYTITFVVSGGKELLPMSVVPGEIPQLPVPVKSNNHFLGWYTSNFYTTKWEETAQMPQEDLTLYARWEVINNRLDNDFSYAVQEDGTAAITDYYGNRTSVAVPSTINGYTITAIADFAFAENETVQTVVLPNTVKRLGAYAFADSSVRVVTGARELTSLGEGCFARAGALSTVFLPTGVTQIPESCFAYCNSLTDLIMPDQITQIGANAFYGCGNLETLEIGENVQTIGADAFAGCPNLTKVTLPSTLSDVDAATFGTAAISYYASAKLRLLTLNQLTKSSVELTWNQVAGADGYRLYRKNGTAGSFSLIKTVTDTQTTNYSLTSGKTYYYKVVAFRNGEAGTQTIAQSQEVGLRVARLTTPTISGLKPLADNTASMKWNAVVGAQGYEVWRAYDRTGEYTLLKTVNGVETVNTGLIGGRTYYYRVRAFYGDGDTREYSAFSPIASYTMPLVYMDAPENLRLRQTAKGTVLLEWDQVENAHGYRIYRRKGNGELALIKTTQTSSAYNYNLTLGETYGYAVEAFTNTDQETIYGEKTSVVSVTIAELATPYIKSVYQSASATALVSWTSVSAADGYELWRSRTENGTYSRMKSVSGTATSNYNLTVGVTYYYKVRAYVKSDSGEVTYSAYSNAVPITVLSVAKTRLKSVEQVDGTAAKITWAYMSGAKHYEVWRSVADDSHFELLRTTSGTSVQDQKLADGQTYYYKVRAYDDSGDTVVYGDFSDAMALCILGIPTPAVVEQSGTNQVYLTWDKVQDADGYELWRSENGGSYTKIKSVQVGATYNYNLTKGATYAYKLRAYRTLNGTNVYSDYSNPVFVKILGKPDVNSLKQNGSDGVRIGWSADPYADGYELWRSLEEDQGVFTRVKTVTGTSTTSFGLYETEASYRLRSYAMVNGQRVYGPFGEAMCISILGTPAFTQWEQVSTSSASLSWEAVNGAEGYRLYRSTTADSGFSLVKTVTDTQTTTYSLQSGQTYYYKVKAIRKDNGVTQESAYSQPIALTLSDLVAPYIRSCNQSSDGAVLTASVTGTVEGIEIWRADSGDTYALVAEGTADQLMDTTIQGGKTYAYKLRSYVTRNGQRVCSAFSKPVTLDTLNAPSFLSVGQRGNDKVYLEWTAVASAQTYELSRTSDNGESETLVGRYTDLWTMDMGLDEERYTYRVRAVRGNGSTESYSAWSAAQTVTTAVYTGDRYPESAHSYANNANQVYTYTLPGAQAISMTFSASTSTEYGYDYIYVLDGNGQCVARLSGSIGQETLVTSGDTFQIYFTTDSSGTRYGFSFDTIAAATLEEATAPSYTWAISGDTIRVDASGSMSGISNRKVFGHIHTLEVAEGATSFTASDLAALSLKEVILPDGLTSIGSSVFKGCTSLKKINIPDTVTSIGAYAFKDCTALDTIALPDGLTTIGNSAFESSGLTRVTIPASLTKMNSSTFANCKALREVTFQSATWTYGYSTSNSVAYGPFSGCENLETVTFADGTTTIGDGLFGNTGIRSITIPATVTKIGSYSFSGCTKLERVIYDGNQVTNLGSYAFLGCTALEEAPICDSVTEIGSNAFRNCTGIRTVTIPASVTQMNSQAFGNCTGLTDVTILGNPGYSYSTNSNYGTAVGPFNGCVNLETVTYASGVTRVGDAMFGGSGIRSVILPETMTEIGQYAFAGCANLKTVTYAGNNVTKIGDYAFAGCSALEKLPLVEGVTEIGNRAFYKCTGLTSVTLPASVTKLNNRPFADCTSLQEVTFLSKTSWTYNYNSSNGTANGPFDGCVNLETVTFSPGITTIGDGLFGGSGIRSITIPETVTKIGSYAFGGCTRLENVTFAGDQLTTLGSYAFSGCNNLRGMTLPDSVTTIDAYSFYKCTGLTQLPTGSNVTSIGDYAFYGCTGLKKLDTAHLTSIGNYAFYGCTGLKTVDLEQLTSVGNYAFYGCTGLKTVDLEQLTSVGNHTFYGCTGLEHLNLGEVTSIGSYSFSGCTGMKTVELGKVTTIGSNAFYGCTGLTELTLPESLTKVSSGAFSNCTGLTDLTLPATFIQITFAGTGTSGVFAGCTSLEKLHFAPGTTGIPSYAFSGSGIREVTLPDTVTEIQAHAFSDCNRLRTIELPEGLLTIGERAFQNCTILKRFTLPSTLTSLGANAFKNCPDITTVTIPGTVEKVSSDLFYNCTGLTRVVMEEGVKTISDDAFYNCKSLKNITVPSTVTEVGSNAFYGVAATTAGPIGGGYDYEFGWTETIPNYAFQYMNELTSAAIPEGITQLGDYAFSYTGVTTVSLPSTLKKIGNRCFCNCESLTQIVIPDGVTTIGNSAFRYCDNLKNITIPGTVTSIGSYAFDGTAVTTAGPIGGGYDLELGWTETIPNSAFRYMSNLTSVVVPEGVTQLGDYAFADTGVTTVSLPSTLKTIGSNCFSNCKSLTQIEIPDGVTTIGDYAFRYCDNLKNITIPGTVTSIGSYAFGGTAVTTAGPIGGGYDLELGWTETIPNSAFRYMSNLTSIVVPEGVTQLGDYAFADTGVTTVSLPSTLKTIGSNCFNNCKSLTQIVIPEGVTQLGSNAFAYTGLTTVSLPSTLETIGDDCFSNSSLTEIVIPDGVTTIGGGAFWGCNDLKNITIPGTVTEVGSYAFSGIAVTTAGPIGGGYDCEFGWTETIPSRGFVAMSNLTSAVIPEGITQLGDYAFSNTGLTSVSLPSTLKEMGLDCFFACSNLTEIEIPDGVTSIGFMTFGSCSSLKTITIPNTVTSIEVYAFDRCSSLEDVYYGGTEEEWRGITIKSNNGYLTNATIHYNSNSAAAAYADNNGLTHPQT